MRKSLRFPPACWLAGARRDRLSNALLEFQRIDGMDSDHAGSGALGLGVCRGIVQSHGGEFRGGPRFITQGRFDIELR